MNDICVALVIFRSWVGQVCDNQDRMVPWVRMAGQAGADVVCFPEMNISGYGIRSAAIMKSEPIPGPTSDRLSALATGEKIANLAGMAEINGAGLYASQILATPDGRIGVYRKLHIPPPEQGIFSPADQVPVFQIKGVLCGVQLCYDSHFPELSTHMAVKGADVIFFPHASPRGTPAEKYASWMRYFLPNRRPDLYRSHYMEESA